jgi:hypothetical protein
MNTASVDVTDMNRRSTFLVIHRHRVIVYNLQHQMITRYSRLPSRVRVHRQQAYGIRRLVCSIQIE